MSTSKHRYTHTNLTKSSRHEKDARIHPGNAGWMKYPLMIERMTAQVLKIDFLSAFSGQGAALQDGYRTSESEMREFAWQDTKAVLAPARKAWREKSRQIGPLFLLN